MAVGVVVSGGAFPFSGIRVQVEQLAILRCVRGPGRRAWRSQSRVLESWSAIFLTTEPMRIKLAGAALTFGGGDAVLGAPDLIFESALFLLLKAQELFLTLAETIL